MIGEGLELMKLANIGANADIHEKLGKFVEKAQDLQAKVEALEEQNKELREQLRFRGIVERINGCSYVVGEQEPICPRCAEVDRRPVHFVTTRHEKMGHLVVCPQCKTQAVYQRRRAESERLLAQSDASRQ